MTDETTEQTPSSTANGRLAGRIALITGASRGIGAAVAKRFGAEGAHLILVAQTVGGLEEIDDEIRAAGGAPATLVPLDLRNFDAIDQMGASIYERFGRLDILVGNAGLLGTLSPVGHIAPKVWSETLDINLTANWRLLRSFDPLLKLSDAGRAVFVTSGAASKHKAYWAIYSATKAALDSLVKIYAAENEKTNICANLLSPGPIRTSMRAKAFPGEDPETLRTPEEITELFVELASADCQRNGEIVEVPR
ncbi:SDR family NAD(P)-dependent oxidoreductase [Pelagibius sp. Alg239-R121]|uniref:SDR family NAD(P)-dependent oxidoreductase n=1 Tax=Pelagibius sp. Alg239-R121 TaxID=2993448 RepID=UPI0024A736CB|nr:SDR family NAD(P)-dependent oxidoreductase [Pelagibius sp. Alg239-R121]